MDVVRRTLLAPEVIVAPLQGSALAGDAHVSRFRTTARRTSRGEPALQPGELGVALLERQGPGAAGANLGEAVAAAPEQP